MKFTAIINFLVAVVLAFGFIGQHTSNLINNGLKIKELQSSPVGGGNLCSHEMMELQDTDDMVSEVPCLTGQPVFIILDVIEFLIPDPAVAKLFPCWQPPEFRS